MDLNTCKDSRATGRNKQGLFITQVLCRDNPKGDVFRSHLRLDLLRIHSQGNHSEIFRFFKQQKTELC